MANPLRVAGTALAVVGLLTACAPSSESAGDVGKGSAPGEAVRVTIDDSVFAPDVLEAAPGEEMTVEVKNDDSIPHDFAIESMDLNTGTIEPGQTAYATFTVPNEPLEFVCTYHDGMDGRIVADRNER